MTIFRATEMTGAAASPTFFAISATVFVTLAARSRNDVGGSSLASSGRAVRPHCDPSPGLLNLSAPTAALTFRHEPIG